VGKTSYLEHNKKLAITSVLALLAGYSAHVIYFDRVIGLDWNYFASLSLVIRSIVWGSHEFPIRDPWVAGGQDLLANPQNRIFSPNLFFDLALDPYNANLISLLFVGLIGMWGMFKLVKSLGGTSGTACLCSVLFINSSWFGNHFAEGHVPFNSFQLLPWALIFLFKQKDRRTIPALFLLFGFWILDGGLYAFIFTIPLLIALTLARLINWREISNRLGQASRSITWLLLYSFAFLLMVSPKIVPLLSLSIDRQPHREFTQMGFQDILVSFFYPWQSPLAQMPGPIPWRMHEYGCYIGSLSLVLFWGILTRNLQKNAIKYLILAAFFFWMGSGLGGTLNPWQVFLRIPLINNAHVQSRLFIFTYIFLILSAIGPLNYLLRTNRIRAYLVFAFMLIEFTIAKAYPSYSAFHGASKSRPTLNLIPNKGIVTTIGFAQKPEHYYSGDKSSSVTYEPAAIPSAVQPIDSKLYRGEAWVSVGTGDISVMHHGPSGIKLAYNLQEKSVVTFNTNFLLGWESNRSDIETRPSSLGLLTAEIPPGKGELVLEYYPWYLNFVLASFLISIPVWVWLFIFRKRRILSGNYDYSQIPLAYYDQVFYSGPSIQRAWHVQKFDRVRDSLPKKVGQSILDIGCFSGTFLSTLDGTTFTRQLGTDILENQISYAQQRYGSIFRHFHCVSDISEIKQSLDLQSASMDCITSIEVIEHLPPEIISKLFDQAKIILKPGGKMIITTPNYLSAWPLIEMLLNYFSPTSYAEQHITKFNWLNIERKIQTIYPDFEENFELELKTTTHFIAPFLAPMSFDYSRKISRSIDHKRWRFPFGNLLMVVISRKNAPM